MHPQTIAVLLAIPDTADEGAAEEATRLREQEDDERDRQQALIRAWEASGADPAKWPFRPDPPPLLIDESEPCEYADPLPESFRPEDSTR